MLIQDRQDPWGGNGAEIAETPHAGPQTDCLEQQTFFVSECYSVPRSFDLCKSSSIQMWAGWACLPGKQSVSPVLLPPR